VSLGNGENLQLRFEPQHFWQQIKFACVFKGFSLTKGVRGRDEWQHIVFGQARK